jgi:hypothetical protein
VLRLRPRTITLRWRRNSHAAPGCRAVIALVLAGCGGGSAVGKWQDESGRTLESYTGEGGEEGCGWESVTFLVSLVSLDHGWSGRGLQQFIRDPEGVLPRSYTLGAYDEDAALPEDAIDTGFRLDSLELWVPATSDDTGPEAVYVVDDDSVERWPRAKSEIVCA